MYKILVVSSSSRVFANQILPAYYGQNVQIVSVKSYVEASKALLAAPTDYSLLIIDHLIQGKSGLQLAQEVRNISLFDNLPIIYLTQRRDDKVYSTTKHGVTAFLRKPICVEKLRELSILFFQCNMSSRESVGDIIP